MFAKLNAQCNRMGFFWSPWSLAKRWQRSKKIGHLPLVLYSFVERDPSHVNELVEQMCFCIENLKPTRTTASFCTVIVQ